MDKTYFKSKYVLIFILSLFIFISGLNYKHWYVTDKLTPKRFPLSIPYLQTILAIKT